MVTVLAVFSFFSRVFKVHIRFESFKVFALFIPKMFNNPDHPI